MGKIYFSRGNTKLKCNVFALPYGKTCKAGVTCTKTCYAKKAEVMYKATKNSRKVNLHETRRKDFVERTVALLKRRQSQITRIHESGDFYSKEYVLKWYDIMNQIPDMTFYAYTKQDVNFKGLLGKKKPANFILLPVKF